MSKVSLSYINYLQNAVETALLVGIENIAIESGIVRGINSTNSVFILQTNNVPILEDNLFVGVNKLKVLQNRLSLIKEQPNFTTDLTIKNDVDIKYVGMFTFKSSNLKIDFRSGNPKLMRGPKKFNDTMKTRIELNKEIVNMIQRGITAMNGDTITIINNDKETFIEILDNNNDVFKYTLPHQAESLDKFLDPSFAFRYCAKTILTLFKHNPEGHFCVGDRGILAVEINGLNVYVMPKV